MLGARYTTPDGIQVLDMIKYLNGTWVHDTFEHIGGYI